MKNAIAGLLVMVIVLGFGGCAVASKFTATGDSHPPYEGTVKVLTEPPADGKFVEIGWVSADGVRTTQWAELIEALQAEAAKKGANAIILAQKDKTGSAVVVSDASADKSMLAIAIRILD